MSATPTPAQRAAAAHTALIRSAIADRDQLRARLELRRSSAATPHRNRRREVTRPGKGNRRSWKNERIEW